MYSLHMVRCCDILLNQFRSSYCESWESVNKTHSVVQIEDPQLIRTSLLSNTCVLDGTGSNGRVIGGTSKVGPKLKKVSSQALGS